MLLPLGLCNCLYLPVWLILTGPVHTYFFPDGRALRVHLADNFAALALGSALLYLLCGLTRGYVRDSVALFCVSVALWSVASAVSPVTMNRGDGSFMVAVVLVCAAAAAIWFRWTLLRQMVENTTIILALLCVAAACRVWQASWKLPVYGVEQSHGLYLQHSSNSPPSRKPRTSREGASGGRVRIVWIIFDELDQNRTFPSVEAARDRFRPALPNFQRLAAESMQMSAMVPSHYRTLAAVPSMLTGHPLSIAAATEAGRTWGGVPNLFSEFHEKGLTTAVLGWHHPYCFVLGSSVDNCLTAVGESLTIEPYLQIPVPPWPVRLQWNFKEVLRNVPLARALRRHLPAGSQDRFRERALYELLWLQTKTCLQGKYDFTLIHFSVPHPPGVALKNGAPGGDYYDNLELADGLLGQVRSILESDHAWSETALLVTGDHHLRLDLWSDQMTRRVIDATRGKEDARTVCLLKLPGQMAGTLNTTPFSALLLHDLVNTIANRTLSDPKAIAAWIEGQASRFPTERVPVR